MVEGVLRRFPVSKIWLDMGMAFREGPGSIYYAIPYPQRKQTKYLVKHR